jgi:hypothetical protein
MGLEFNLETNLGPAIAWTVQMQRQLPFAASLALNRTAYNVQQRLNSETVNYLNEGGPPTRFTQRAFRFTRSTKSNLEVTVGAAPIQSRYLRFAVKGGARPAKGFERKFLSQVTSTRSIPTGTQLVPTSMVKLNSSGNVSLATIKRIQAGMNGDPRGGFFYGVPRGGNRPVGIYRRSRERLFPYFVGINGKARYRPQFPIGELGYGEARQVFNGHLMSALQQALATAR